MESGTREKKKKQELRKKPPFTVGTAFIAGFIFR